MNDTTDAALIDRRRRLLGPAYRLFYDPPLLLADGPLSLGKSWVNENVQFLDSEGNPDGVPVDIAYTVNFEGPV